MERRELDGNIREKTRRRMMRCVKGVPYHPGGLRKGTNNWLTVHSKG